MFEKNSTPSQGLTISLARIPPNFQTTHHTGIKRGSLSQDKALLTNLIGLSVIGIE